MRRLWTLLASTSLVVIAIGCGADAYETRLARTIDDIKYKKKVDDNLMPPLVKSRLEEVSVFLRPPRTLTETKAFQLGAIDTEQFDSADSFLDSKAGWTLHVLTRIRQQKAAPTAKKKGPVAHGDYNKFIPDVLGIVGGVYNATDVIATQKPKTDVRKANEFKHWTIAADGKTVQVYCYRKDPFQAALVFEYASAPPAGEIEKKQLSMIEKINLCLDNLVVGPAAKSMYQGGGEPIESGGDAAAPAPATAF